VYSGDRQFSADEIFICSGEDFETLYPEVFSAAAFTKCKLQMMRMQAQPDDWRIGPSLCAGLSLLHYNAFKVGESWKALKEFLTDKYPDHIKLGIHVMVSQNQEGELTIGDSHEYGPTHDPFTREFINDLILDYLETFARFRTPMLTERWNGVYPKTTDGSTEFVHKPASGVTIVNGIGGAGMTLSFGLCEELMRKSD
jgi:FAD dependent oxidoreductase TIGR03364